MATYARIVDSYVVEIILPFLGEDGIEVPIELRFTPDIVAMLVLIPEGVTVENGYTYIGGVFAPPVDNGPPPVTEAQAKADRDARLYAAVAHLLPLQCAVALGQETAAEGEALSAWQAYCMFLGRVTEQPGFPSHIVWPEQPV